MCRIAQQQPLYAGRNSGRCGGGGSVRKYASSVVRGGGWFSKGLAVPRAQRVCPGQQHPRKHVTSMTSAVPVLTSLLTSFQKTHLPPAYDRSRSAFHLAHNRYIGPPNDRSVCMCVYIYEQRFSVLSGTHVHVYNIKRYRRTVVETFSPFPFFSSLFVFAYLRFRKHTILRPGQPTRYLVFIICIIHFMYDII